jgi:hypothetical protein
MWSRPLVGWTAHELTTVRQSKKIAQEPIRQHIDLYFQSIACVSTALVVEMATLCQVPKTGFRAATTRYLSVLSWEAEAGNRRSGPQCRYLICEDCPL